jgi:energy-coupling factor transporter ATP-binding protein EcfA2
MLPVREDNDNKDDAKKLTIEKKIRNYSMIILTKIYGFCMDQVFAYHFIKRNNAVSTSEDLENGNKSKSSRWNFWNIYIEEGLKGSIFKLFYMNPIVPFLVMCEIWINIIGTYATTTMIDDLTKITKTINASNHKDPEQQIEEYHKIYFVLLLIGVIFTPDFSKLVKRLTRTKTMLLKLKIIQRIETKIVEHIHKLSYENEKEFGTNEIFEALNRFAWVYDNITDTLIDTAIQITRTIIFCSYMIYQETLLLPIFVIIYFLIWKYIVPYTIVKRKTENGQKFWERSYYDVIKEFNITTTNPLLKRLYFKNINENDSIKLLDADTLEEKEIMDQDNKLQHPNIVKRYMETIIYYAKKHLNWSDSHDLLQFSQHLIISLILVFMFFTKRYEVVTIVLINRHTMFGIINTYNDLKQCEHQAERSMEEIIKILDAVDKQFEANNFDKIPMQLVDVTQDKGKRRKVKTITITDLRIKIPSQTQNNKNETKTDEKTLYSQSVSYDRFVELSSANIEVSPHKCLLVDGETACGKSVTLDKIAGRYSGKICSDMTIKFMDGTFAHAEFNCIKGSLYYVSQLLAEEYKYNNSIKLPLYKLFPGAKNLDEVMDFLTKVFAIKQSSISSSLKECPHSKLSGGEVQRYVVASQIWCIIKVEPDIVILDEIDRALDKETALKIIRWIMTNINCFVVIVTHLTEVKTMLYKEGFISQLWTYDSSDHKNIKIINKEIDW